MGLKIEAWLTCLTSSCLLNLHDLIFYHRNQWFPLDCLCFNSDLNYRIPRSSGRTAKGQWVNFIWYRHWWPKNRGPWGVLQRVAFIETKTEQFNVTTFFGTKSNGCLCSYSILGGLLYKKDWVLFCQPKTNGSLLTFGTVIPEPWWHTSVSASLHLFVYLPLTSN